METLVKQALQALPLPKRYPWGDFGAWKMATSGSWQPSYGACSRRRKRATGLHCAACAAVGGIIWRLSAGLMAIAGAGWLRMPAQIGARDRGECPKMSHFHGPGAIAKQSGTMAGVL